MVLSDGLIGASLESMTAPPRRFKRIDSAGWSRSRGSSSSIRSGSGSAGERDLHFVDSSAVITLGSHNYITELTAQVGLAGPIL